MTPGVNSPFHYTARERDDACAAHTSAPDRARTHRVAMQARGSAVRARPGLRCRIPFDQLARRVLNQRVDKRADLVKQHVP